MELELETSTESKPNREKPTKIMTEKEFSDLDSGWSWVVMFASFINLSIIGGNVLGVGIIHSALVRKYQESITLTSWAGTLQVAVCSLGGPLSSAVADRFSCRTAVILSGVCFVSGYLGTAFAPDMVVAIFTCGIISGLGGGFGYTASAAVVGLNFKRRRNIALGFVLSGLGVGLFAFAPLMKFALEFYGPVGFFITLATISANMITFGTMMFPNSLELYAWKARKINGNVDTSKTVSNRLLKSYVQSLCIKPVICLCFSLLLYGNGLYVIFLYLPSYFEVSGFTPSQIAFFMSMIGIFSVIGRFLTGFITNFKWVDEIWVNAGSMFIVSFSAVIYPFIADSYVGQIVFIALLGMFHGNCFIMMAPVGIRFVGIQFVSAAIGIQLFFCGIGSMIGPVCSGIVVDSGGTYKQCFIFAAVSIFVAAILNAVTTAFSTKSPKDECTAQQVYDEQSERLTPNEM